LHGLSTLAWLYFAHSLAYQYQHATHNIII
jgi:hypothetical protein